MGHRDALWSTPEELAQGGYIVFVGSDGDMIDASSETRVVEASLLLGDLLCPGTCYTEGRGVYPALFPSLCIEEVG